MDCKKIHKVMADYLCDALPQAEAEEVRRHIESCPACRAEAEAYEATWKLAGEIRDVKPAPGFSRAVRERLERAPRPVRRRPAARRPAFVRAAVAVAASVLVAVGLYFLYIQEKTPIGPEQETQLSEAEKSEIIRNLGLLVNFDTLDEESLETGDVDILKEEVFEKVEELTSRDIDIGTFTPANSNGNNGEQ